MQNKLQELTDKLYNEGLSKGKAEGEQLLAEAREKSESIIAEAKKQAGEIIAKAHKEAEDLRTKVASDVKAASAQCLQATKKDIENLIIGNSVDASVKDALTSADFVKSVITLVAEKFSAQESADLKLILPESMKSKLEPFVASELSEVAKRQISAEFSKKLSGGFTIGPKDGSYFVSFTDETFKELIGEYLRPVTKKVLFG